MERSRVVDSADKGRGYEVDKGVFIPVDDEEVEALQVESKHTVEIDSFVPAEQIDKRFYDSPYYIAPNDNVGDEAFAVIRDAMRGKGVVALGRIVLNKRERVIALEPCGKGILGTTLRYPYEVRKAEEYFDDIKDIKLQGEMLKLAEHILETKKADFDPSEFQDHYEVALVEMLREKQAGFKPPKGKSQEPSSTNVVNLMDALRKSLSQSKTAAPPTKKGKKRIEGQREMLLPISGKGQKEEKKAPSRPAARRKTG